MPGGCRMKRAVIITPTLDVTRAAATCAQAQRLAGFPCGIVIIGEETRRGGVIPTNAGLISLSSLEKRPGAAA